MPAIGMGCMHASAEVVAVGLAAGVTLVDTADAYENEAAVGAVIADWRASGGTVEVVAKGGLTRPGGAWVPDGRAVHLAAAARASRERLGAIDLYLLHAVDPKVPLATSVRALAKLRDAGVARAIGVSNVALHQLEQALAVTQIDAVEIEVSPWQVAGALGVISACAARGIRVLAHRPLGGAAGAKRLAKDPDLRAIGARLGATPAEVALAWLRTLDVVPLPGPTRIETARSCARLIELDGAARELLDAKWRPAARGAARAGEVVMLMGMPGAGKSTRAERYVADGYARLNRDDRGRTLKQLAQALDAELARSPRVVLDNTYPTRSTRAPVIAAAHKHGVRVRCEVVATSLEDAQRNAAARIVERYGRLLEPAELAREQQIGPSAQFRYRRQYEPPRLDEGLDAIDEVAFERAAHATGAPAVIVELDDLVWRGRPRAATDVALIADALDIRAALAAWRAAGFALAATTWQPESFDPEIDRALADALGVTLPVARCHHPAGPPVCWCRKPLPGLALLLAHAHGFALDASVHVGRGPADRGFAARAGLRYVEVGAAAAGLPRP